MSKLIKLFILGVAAFNLMIGVGNFSLFAANPSQKVESTKGKKINVNTATLEELESIPGIGAVYAEKIIKGRPYKTKGDLVKAGLPEKTVEKISSDITFGQKTPVKHEKKTETVQTKSKIKEKTQTDEIKAQVPPRKGMVWVNTDSKIYHKEGDHWYGKTKNGKFMSEEEAIKSGARLSNE